jgi:hypothetical protein
MNILLRLKHSIALWLEKVDPYYTQRIILRKGLFLAVLMTAINWIAKPDVFGAYAVPAMLLAGFYELPSLNTYKQKDQALVFGFIVSGIGCVTFYLLFPFKFTLLFFALAHFTALYFFSDRYFPKFKPLVLQTIVVSAINMTILPAASLQIAIDMFFCVMLSLMVTFIAFKIHPNLYAKVWHRAFSYYLAAVVEEIGHAINKFDTHTFATGAAHLNVLRAYRRLLPRKLLLNITKTTVNIRNIQFALNHIYLKDKDEQFWYSFQKEVNTFRLAVIAKNSLNLPLTNKSETDFTQNYVTESLRKSINNWNKICKQV